MQKTRSPPIIGFAMTVLAALLTPTAVAAEIVPLGGGAGLGASRAPCTLATIGRNAAGELIGFTSTGVAIPTTRAHRSHPETC
jgi:hypothetical protein